MPGTAQRSRQSLLLFFYRAWFCQSPQFLDSYRRRSAENKEKVDYTGIAKIGIEDFTKVDLRVAQIIECEPVKKAKKLLKLTLNDGSGVDRTVASGIALYYKPEELLGKKVILVQNLNPATLCGVESHGMILAADTDDTVKVIFVDGMENGAKIH